jgi:hypothetical protein
VALSRHRAHATVVIDSATKVVLDSALTEMRDSITVAIQQGVLRFLLAVSCYGFEPRADRVLDLDLKPAWLGPVTDFRLRRCLCCSELRDEGEAFATAGHACMSRLPCVNGFLDLRRARGVPSQRSGA